MSELPERDRQIFVKRRIDEDRRTLGELGAQFKISPERVRQIEHGVFTKIRASLQQAMVQRSYA